MCNFLACQNVCSRDLLLLFECFFFYSLVYSPSQLTCCVEFCNKYIFHQRNWYIAVCSYFVFDVNDRSRWQWSLNHTDCCDRYLCAFDCCIFVSSFNTHWNVTDVAMLTCCLVWGCAFIYVIKMLEPYVHTTYPNICRAELGETFSRGSSRTMNHIAFFCRWQQNICYQYQLNIRPEKQIYRMCRICRRMGLSAAVASAHVECTSTASIYGTYALSKDRINIA